MSSEADLTNAGWISYGNSGCYIGITTSYYSTGSKALLISAWDGSTNSDSEVAALPVLNTPVNELQITLSYRQRTGGNVKVGYLTDANDASTFVSIMTLTQSTSSFTTTTVAFNEVPSTAARIAIQQYGWYDCYIDDIDVRAIPSCDKPELSNSVSSTQTTAIITWTPADGHNLFDIYWSTSNTAPTDETTPSAANQTGTSYTIEGLTPSTQYYVWIRGNCGTASDPDVSGGWTTAVGFKTKCEIESITTWGPENFDDYTTSTGFLPDCWARINTSTHASYNVYPYVYNSSSTAYSGNNSLRFYSYYSSWGSYDPQDQYAILPPMDNIAGKQITMQVKGYNTNSTFKIGLMSNPDDISTFELIKEQTGLTESYQEFAYNIPDGTTANYIVIMIEAANSDRASNGIYIDDITIAEPPTCIKPTDLTKGEVTAHTAELSWTSDAEAWQICVNDDEEDLIDVTTTSYTLEELTAETAYTVKVRTVCESSEVSEWTSAVSFTTAIACPKPTALTATLTPGNGTVATFSWTETGEATAWQLCIDGDEENLIDMDTNPFTYDGFTAETTYTAKVRAVCGGIDGESAWSNTCSFTPTNAYMITLNDKQNTNSYIPIANNYADYGSRSQFILPATALASMQFGYIEKLTFYTAKNDFDYSPAEWQIYVAEVEYTTFDETAFTDWSTLTPVYNGTLSITNNEMQIDLGENAYQYTGGNLLIGFDQTVFDGNYASFNWYGETQASGVYTAVYKTASASHTYSGNPSRQAYLPKVTINYTPGEAPSCIKPTGLEVNYEGGSTATVSFTSDATAWNLDVNGTIQPIEENPYTLKDLELATTYVIKVQADCGNSQSDWTNAVSFTTDLCLAEDMCDLTFVLTDSYGDSWNGAYIEVVDVLTGITIAQMANENLNGTSGSGENEVNTKTLAVCDGREIQFVWHKGSFDSEASYAVYDINNEEIFSGSGAMSAPVDYTVNCAPITCAKPTDLEANPVGNTAIISWTSEASAWQLCLNDDEENLIDVDENPYTLKELELSTDYTVKVRANCGDEGYSNWTTNVSFTTGECTLEDACELSYELKVTEGYEQYGWYGSYLLVYDNEENILAYWTVEADQGTATGTLGVCDGKELVFSWYSGSNYDDLLIGSIKVYDVGGNLIIDSNSALTDDVEYTMNCNVCPAVTGVTATAGVNSAVVSWEGEHATFDLQYKQDITYHFEDGLGAWTTIDADGDGFNWLWSESGISGYQGSKCLYSQSYDNNGEQALDPDNYLVSPKVKLGGSISFYACSQDGDWLEHFGVAVSTTGNTSAADFTTIQDWTCASAKAQSPWTLYTADLSEYAGEEGYVAIRHYDSENKFYLDIDEITILEPGQTMPEWILVEDVTSPYTLEPLTEETTYAVQVRGYCQGETEPTPWSSLVNFTTVSGNVFIANGGNWNVDENWLGGSVPEAGSSVVIAANVIVPAGYVADAGKITVEGNATITVEDGGQLKTTYGGVAATMKKSIDPHSGVGEEMTGWNFIASPVISDLSPIAVTNLMTENEDDYDLYAFDGTATDAEWMNYKQHSETFMIYNGQGYLYANAGDVDLEFTGELNPTNLTKKYTLEASGSGDFAGFFLMGNPFSCNAYLAGGEDFYVMNEVGSDIVPAISNTIAPLQGYFVKVDGTLNLNVTTTAPVNEGKGLVMSLSQNRGPVFDNAIIRFGEGNGLNKVQLNPKHTKLYIPQDNKDYAVVYSNTEGEMPVNFKAEKMGQYTISFNLEGTSFGYMHLYDKLTGNDVNLLTSPNYTFTGTPQDNEDRFILRFSSSASSDIFAYQSGSDVIVSGEGTLQVFDVLGRYVDSYEINGVQTIKSMPMGVYIFRMIGNEVKTQKIVVR